MMLATDAPDMHNNNAPESHYEYVVAVHTSDMSMTQVIATDAEASKPMEVTTDAVSESTEHVEVNVNVQVVEHSREASEEITTPIATTLTDKDLLERAKLMKEVFADGFQWSDLASIVKQSYAFLHQYKGLSSAEMRANVIKIIDYLIDITDTPFLPDKISDPIFKSMVPPFVALMGFAIDGAILALPTTEAEKPTAERLFAFAKTLKDSFSDGFQWTDIATCIRASAEFLGTFPSMTIEEKRECVIQVIDGIIDLTDTPKLPDAISDPIFKMMVKPFIETIFEKIAG